MKPEESTTPDKQSTDAWVEREPSTEPRSLYQDSVAPQNSYQNQPSVSQPTAPHFPSSTPAKKHRPLLIVSAIIITMIVVFGGLIAMMLVTQQLHPVKKSNTAVTKPETPQTPLVAYTKASDKSLVVTRDTKTLATVLLPSGKNRFEALAANDTALLVLAAKNASDTSPAGFLIKSDGATQSLTPSIAATVRSQTTFGTATGYLDENHNFLSVRCKDTSCTLESTNLTSGTVTTVLTEGFTPPKQKASATSMALLGISNENIAYLTIYSGNNSTDPIGTLIAVDLDSGSTKKSLIMPKAAAGVATFSPDFSYALYTQRQDNATGNLINWEKGSNKQVTGSISNGTRYLWSPDSKRALFLNSPHGQTSTLGMITVSNAAQTVLKTFPTSETTTLAILGWIDNTTIEYQLTASGKTTTHTLDVDSGQDKVLPTAKAQTLLPVASPLQSH